MLIETPKKNWRTARADSFGELVSFVANTQSYWQGQSSKTGSLSFTGTKTLDEAFNLARFGWPEGCARMAKGMAQAAMLKPPAPVPVSSYDVAGGFPDVGLFIAGDPCCMVNIQDDENAARPIVRFVVSLSISGGVSNEAITNRGAAILTYVDKLQAEGTRVELSVVLASRGSSNAHFCMAFPLKAASEPLDIDKCAFVLAHPAMLRRLCFGVFERATAEANYGSGYGTPSDELPADWTEGKSVYFGSVSTGSSFHDMASAMATVERTIERAIG